MTRIKETDVCATVKKKKNKIVSYFLFQLIPEAYLPSPLLFPFPPKSHDILGVNAIRGFTEDGRLVSHILSNECCWFTQSGHAIARIPDGLLVRMNFNISFPDFNIKF
jgi:hypothetical protein